MASFFPGGLDSFTPKVDLVDTVLASHVNDLQNAVASLEIGGVSKQNIAYAASITPNVPAGEYVIVGTLTGNITINAPTNALTGRRLTFRFTQDGTGGRTVTWNSIFKITNWTVNTGANAVTEATFTYDGTNWFLASNPVSVGGNPLTWGGVLFHCKDPANPNGAAVGLLGGQTVDDTSHLQGLINKIKSIQQVDAAYGGAIGFLDADTFRVTALTYDTGRWTLRGAGMRSTSLRKIDAAATFIIGPNGWSGNGTNQQDVNFEDFSATLWYTSVAAGCISLEGYQQSTVRRVFFDGPFAGAPGVLLKGHGAGSTGDGMYCTVQECEFNAKSSAGTNCIQLSQGAGGSHPDRFRILNNFCNGNSTTTFLMIDNVASGFVADTGIVAFNRIEGAAVPWDVNTIGTLFLGNQSEVTGGGTMTVYVRPKNGGSGQDSLDNTFIANVYATGGDATKFLFSDTNDPASRTTRIADGVPGDGTASTGWYWSDPDHRIKVLAYSASMAANVDQAEIQQIVATNGTAFTIANPVNPAKGRRVTYDLKNSSGGALGAITLGAALLPAGAWVAPANGKRRLYSYYYDLASTSWIELFRSAADI